MEDRDSSKARDSLDILSKRPSSNSLAEGDDSEAVKGKKGGTLGEWKGGSHATEPNESNKTY